MNIVKSRFYAALAAGIMLAATAAPLAARDPDTPRERPERTERREVTETPYSNRSQRRERAERREAEKIEKDRDDGFYHFGRRRPTGGD